MRWRVLAVFLLAPIWLPLVALAAGIYFPALIFWEAASALLDDMEKRHG